MTECTWIKKKVKGSYEQNKHTNFRKKKKRIEHYKVCCKKHNGSSNWYFLLATR